MVQTKHRQFQFRIWLFQKRKKSSPKIYTISLGGISEN